MHLRSLEGRQNIRLPLLMCGCNREVAENANYGRIRSNRHGWNISASVDQSLFSLTLNSDFKGGAVTLILCWHFTPVAPSISRDHFVDLHFISIDLGEKNIIKYYSVISERRRSCQTSFSHTYLSISVISFFELHVFPSLAAQVKPLPLQPLHGRFPGQGGWVNLGYESDIHSCNWQTTINSSPFLQITLKEMPIVDPSVCIANL